MVTKSVKYYYYYEVADWFEAAFYYTFKCGCEAAETVLSLGTVSRNKKGLSVKITL
jgi:hypothetical protein